MPELSLEFEVFCGTCNNGLCNKTEVRTSYKRSMPQLTVEVCDKCIKEKDEEIESLQNDVTRLEETVDNLRERLSQSNYEGQQEHSEIMREITHGGG